jgi:hypothetical protein
MADIRVRGLTQFSYIPSTCGNIPSALPTPSSSHVDPMHFPILSTVHPSKNPSALPTLSSSNVKTLRNSESSPPFTPVKPRALPTRTYSFNTCTPLLNFRTLPPSSRARRTCTARNCCGIPERVRSANSDCSQATSGVRDILHSLSPEKDALRSDVSFLPSRSASEEALRSAESDRLNNVKPTDARERTGTRLDALLSLELACSATSIALLELFFEFPASSRSCFEVHA